MFDDASRKGIEGEYQMKDIRMVRIRILRFDKKADAHKTEMDREIELSGRDILEIQSDGFTMEVGP